MDRLFLELIHVALGRREDLGHAPSADEWAALYREAVRQTMAAVLFAGIGRLPAAQRPPRPLLLQWFALTERTREMNRRMDRETVRVCDELERAGFGVVVLKGQGVAAGYPDPSLRQPGDIDAWVVRDGGKDFPRGNFRAVTGHARRLDPQASVQLLHTDFRLSELTEVEAHFWPSYFFSPLRQYRLRRWATRRLPSLLAHRTRLPGTDGDVCTPTAEFNTVYLLLHIYRHLFHEGIGLRQLLDYHYCLPRPNSRPKAAKPHAARCTASACGALPGPCPTCWRPYSSPTRTGCRPRPMRGKDVSCCAKSCWRATSGITTAGKGIVKGACRPTDTCRTCAETCD